MPKKRLGDYLRSKELCEESHIELAMLAQEGQQKQGMYKPLGRILLEGGHIYANDLNHVLEQQRLDVLKKVSIFKNLDQNSLREVVEMTEQQSYPEKTVIFRQGEPGDTFCVVIAGSLRVFRTLDSGLETTLALLGEGEGLGEMSLMTGEDRSASVETAEPSSLVIISRDSFFRFCRENPDFAIGCIQSLCERVAQDNLHIERRSKDEFILKQLFGKYTTPEIRDEIIAGRIPLDGEFKEVTMLFSDLRNFTPMVESTHPKEVIRILNCYFTEMSEAIGRNKGLVLQYVGDEIEAVFGAPLYLDGHSTWAVQAALEMQRRLAQLNRELCRQGRTPLRHGIGIHTGKVLAANVGSRDRMSYALVGDTVNLASRIQGLNKEFGTEILVSKATRVRIDDDFPFQPLPVTQVKGKSHPVEVFSLPSYPDRASDESLP